MPFWYVLSAVTICCMFKLYSYVSWQQVGLNRCWNWNLSFDTKNCESHVIKFLPFHAYKRSFISSIISKLVWLLVGQFQYFVWCLLILRESCLYLVDRCIDYSCYNCLPLSFCWNLFVCTRRPIYITCMPITSLYLDHIVLFIKPGQKVLTRYSMCTAGISYVGRRCFWNSILPPTGFLSKKLCSLQ